MTAGIDLTDGTVRAVAVDVDGRVLARSEQSAADRDAAAAVKEALTAFRALGDGGPSVIGVATPNPGELLPPGVTALLADEIPGAFMTVGAGAAAALAEAWSGAAVGCDHLVVFGVGRHVTAGLIVGGRLLGGAHDLAGSVGWLAMNPVEREDYRRLGGLEAEIGAAGVVRRLVWRIKSGDRSAVSDQVSGDLTRINADMVFEAARAGDGVCVSVVRDTIKYVGMAIANLAAIVDPERIVVGGTIAAGGDLTLEAIRAESRRRMRTQQADALRIVLSTLGADAVSIGAARAALLERR
jgi:predicted NBD/HSP70 family sugar kinase